MCFQHVLYTVTIRATLLYFVLQPKEHTLINIAHYFKEAKCIQIVYQRHSAIGSTVLSSTKEKKRERGKCAEREEGRKSKAIVALPLVKWEC